MSGTILEIALPERSDDELSEALRDLTAVLDARSGDESLYGLGGKNGYGSNYETDEFMMHRFCWCDRMSCPWCGGCECEAGGTCTYCTGERHREHGAVAGMGAPNFWHKPSGLRVWWYKWIGRSNDVRGPEGIDPAAIVRSCILQVSA